MSATAPVRTSRRLSSGDIGPQPKIAAGTVPAIARFAGKFAEATTAVLTGMANAPWRVAIDKIEDVGLPVTDELGGWFRMESQAGSMTMHMAFDRMAISALCEAALGGTGTEPPYEFPERPLSSIETDLLRVTAGKLQTRLAAILSDILATPVSLFEGVVEPTGPSGQQEQTLFRFIVNLFGYGAEIRLSAGRQEFMTQFEAAGLAGESGAVLGEQRAGLQRQIGRTHVGFIVSLGSESLTVEELATLAPGRHLKLAATMHAPVVVSSDGNPIFTASIARTGDKLAVRLLAPYE